MMKKLCIAISMVVLVFTGCGNQKEVKYTEWSEWTVYKYSDRTKIDWNNTDLYEIEDLGAQSVPTGTRTMEEVIESYVYKELLPKEFVLPEGKTYEIYVTHEQIAAEEYSSSLYEILSDWEKTDETVIWHSDEEILVPAIDVKWEMDSHSIVDGKIEYVYRKYVRKVSLATDLIGNGVKTDVMIYALIPSFETIKDSTTVYDDVNFYRDRTREVIK